jgi:hypothetical protein
MDSRSFWGRNQLLRADGVLTTNSTVAITVEANTNLPLSGACFYSAALGSDR